MKKRCLLFLLVLALLLSACATAAEEEKPSEEPQGQIYLYGEYHAGDDCLQKELEIWGEYYETGMRDLFIEYSYSDAAFLNEWMQADSDEILMQLYQDSEGTLAHSQNVLDFYRTIKEKYPETVFHGTDVCHQYDSTGERYLALLRERGLEDSDEYALAIENIEQAKTFYDAYEDDSEAFAYRENCMVENFIRAFEANGGKSVMGIYGCAHVDPESLDYYGTVPSMGMQLAERYGEALHSRDLTKLEFVRTETMTVNGKDYEADYYGVCEDWWPGRSPAFWMLKDAYEDFKDCPFMGEESVDNLIIAELPVKVQDQQVYVIELTSSDGEVERLFYLANGYTYPDFPGKISVIRCIDVE